MTQDLFSELDSIDKEILRTLQKRRPLVSRRIAFSVGISPVAISPRLSRLKKLGILKIAKKSKMRVFHRTFGTSKKRVLIKSPRSISWDFDLKDEV